jgi:hypothetical protein
METRISTGIDTDLFYSIIKYLTKAGWRVSVEYSTEMFDKGIDFDLYQLEPWLVFSPTTVTNALFKTIRTLVNSYLIK